MNHGIPGPAHPNVFPKPQWQAALDHEATRRDRRRSEETIRRGGILRDAQDHLGTLQAVGEYLEISKAAVGKTIREGAETKAPPATMDFWTIELPRSAGHALIDEGELKRLPEDQRRAAAWHTKAAWSAHLGILNVMIRQLEEVEGALGRALNDADCYDRDDVRAELPEGWEAPVEEREANAMFAQVTDLRRAMYARRKAAIRELEVWDFLSSEEYNGGMG